MTYRTLQTFSDKSAMVTKSLEYLGEVLKYIKPYLGKKVSSAGLQLTYGIMGMYFIHVFAAFPLLKPVKSKLKEIYRLHHLILRAGIRKHKIQWFAEIIHAGPHFLLCFC